MELLSFIFLMTSIFSMLFAFYNYRDDPFWMSVLTGYAVSAFFMTVTITVINLLLERQKEEVIAPARHAAYRDAREIYMKLRFLWGRMVADAFSIWGWNGPAPNLNEILNGEMWSVDAANIAANLDLDSFVTMSSTQTWDEYLEIQHDEILSDISKCLARYATMLPPRVIKALHSIETSSFIEAINRRKEEIHHDMRAKNFGYGGGFFSDFFDGMRDLHAGLVALGDKLTLDKDDALPSADCAQDLSSLSGDILARATMRFPLQGQTYFTEFNYRQFVKNCISSSMKYVLFVFPVVFTNRDGSEIAEMSDNITDFSWSLDSYCVRRAKNSRNLDELFIHADPRANAVAVVPFAVSDLHYPMKGHLAQLEGQIKASLEVGQIPGLVFNRGGHLLWS